MVGQQERGMMGQLLISVKEGKGFAIEEITDVYCVLQIETQQIQTTVCTKIPPKAQPTWNEGYNFDITSPEAEIFIGVWSKTASSPDGKCLGTVTMPVKTIGYTNPDKHEIGTNSHRSHVWMPLSSTDHPKAQIRCDLYYNAVTQRVGLEDFTILKQLGRGAFGDVMLVQKKDTGGLYAMKVCKKEKIISMDVVDLAIKERNLIKSFNHPFVVSLKYSFKTKRHLFLIMDYIGGGELFYHMAERHTFDEETVKFYAAQIVLALSFLHEHNIIYRDLKPENLLLDIRGNICLCDFGLCKEQHGTDLSYTMCGSTEYMSPEALRGKGYGKEVDWWALGVVLYEMLTGKCLFQGPSKPEVHDNILYGPIPFTDTMSKEAMSLIINLLKRDPTKRLGSGPKDAEDIKAHAFFKGIDWKKLLHKELEPPFKPHLVGSMDLKYFDPACTEATPELAASPRLDSFDENFGAFSYVAPLEVFRSDQGIQFLKGASFGKLPIFPHLERSYSASPHSWNPLGSSSPRLSLAHSGGISPRGDTRLSIMMASTPPHSSLDGTPPANFIRKKNSNISITIPSTFQRDLSTSPSEISPRDYSPRDVYKLRRPFSLPDNYSSSPSPQSIRHAHTIGHSQRQRRLSDYDDEDTTTEDREAPAVLMQQGEFKEEEMGITRRVRNDNTTEDDGRLSKSTSGIQRSGLKDSKEDNKDGKRLSREDRKMKKSFKDIFSGFFNKKASSASR